MSDLIKREDAIKAIDELPNAYNGWSDAYDKAYIISTLEEVPSADRPQKVIAQVTFDEEKLREIVKEAVERIKEEYEIVDRPQGEWIDAEIPLESGGSMPIQVCNLCKTFYPLAYTGGGHRFCPNCGAHMRGGKDD